MKKRLLATLLLCFCFTWPLLAQIQITFPIARMVFQRNNNNEATVRIGGYYSAAFTRIQVRAEPLAGGTLIDWTTIQENPKGGAFSGTLTMRGGWYRLKIRGLQGEQYVEGGGLEPMGVGEVFVVAGQSNAQGFIGYGAPEVGSDQVSYVDYSIGQQSTFDPPFPGFSRMTSGSSLFPRGKSSWCWGPLGERLVQRFNVPVLFFNAAWEGTASYNWRETVDGGRSKNPYTPDYYPDGQPYGNLRTALNYYVHTLGVRAILWHQGETDNRLDTSPNDYLNNLRVVIQKTRDHSGKNITWVVARASYDDLLGVDNGVRSGQNLVAQNVSNVFSGPDTDGIQIPRVRDDVHFHDGGLTQLADAWSASLNDNFFQNSQPQSPTAGPTVAIACGGNNNLTLRVDGNYNSITWTTVGNQQNVGSGQAVTLGNGQYMATVKDGSGNTSFIPAYRVPDRPSISASGPQTFCEGGNVTLTSSTDNTTWSNSNTGRTITVATAGVYRATYRDVSGCDFVSDAIQINVNPLPAPATVNALNPVRFCEREFTTLQASNASSYNWSTGEKTQQIQVRRGGTYSLTVTDQNGCTSRESNRVVVTVDPLPTRPTISASGPTTFCADQSITLTSTAEQAYVWSSGQTTRSITLSQGGAYSLRTRNSYGCLSDASNIVNLTVNALPPAPTLSANGPTTFCDGNRVTLSVSGSLKAFWNVGDSTQSITATRAGNYAARVRDNNGCYSPSSQPITVDVKAVPSVPTVVQIGTYTLEATGSRQGDYYEWQRDNTVLPLSTPIIKANQTGAYRTRAFLAYENGLVCSSNFSAALAFLLVSDNDGLSIYPNPSPDKQVIIETLENLTNATLTLYTLSGQQIWTTTVGVFNERKVWNLTTVPSGHYVLTVQSGSFKVSKRLLIGL